MFNTCFITLANCADDTHTLSLFLTQGMGRVTELAAKATEVIFQADGTLDETDVSSQLLYQLVGKSLQVHRNVVSPVLRERVLQEMLTENNVKSSTTWSGMGLAGGADPSKLICSSEIRGGEMTQEMCSALCSNQSFPYSKLRINARTHLPADFVVGTAAVYDVEQAVKDRLSLHNEFNFKEIAAVNNINFHGNNEVPMHCDRAHNGGVGDSIITAVLRAQETSTVVLEGCGQIYKFIVQEGDIWCMLSGSTYGRLLHASMRHGVCAYPAPKGMCQGTRCNCRVVQNVRLGKRSFD
jgi:hypothetical protein